MTFKLTGEWDDLKIWEVNSHSSNESYVVSTDNENHVFCSCPHFTHRLSKDSLVSINETHRHCKHITEVLGGNQFGYKNTKIKKTSNT